MSEDERYREFLEVQAKLFERHGDMCRAVIDTPGDGGPRGCRAARTRRRVSYRQLLDADPEVVEFRARFPDTDSVWRRHREETGGLSIMAPLEAAGRR